MLQTIITRYRVKFLSFSIRSIASTPKIVIDSADLLKNFYKVTADSNDETKLTGFGKIYTVADGIVKIKGLAHVKSGELVLFTSTNEYGLIMNL
jgi:F0F1-type ATP synthase alpha subunit